MRGAKIRFAEANLDFPAFTWQKWQVVVVPEDGKKFLGGVSSLHQTQANKKSKGGASVFDRDAILGFTIGSFSGFPEGFDGGRRERLQSGEVGVSGLRRIVPLGLLKVQNIGLGGEPVEIAA